MNVSFNEEVSQGVSVFGVTIVMDLMALLR